MEKELSKEKLSLFELILHNFSTAIKNSVLYSTDHSVFEFSVKNFLDSLNEWFKFEGSLELGVSHDNVLLSGAFVKGKNELHKEIAEFLHQRGIIAVIFEKGLELKSLLDFFDSVREEPKVIRAKRGIASSLPPDSHIRIKEIDYSLLLGSIGGELTGSEEELWRSLTDIAEIAKGGALPESKSEFIVSFLKDYDKSATVLNKVFKQALNKLETEEAVKRIHESLARIYRYFDRVNGAVGEEANINLSLLIARLTPELVMRLFEPAVVDGAAFNLADRIARGFSDDFISDFIGSLVSTERSFNENLLLIFDKLLPDPERATSIAAMVADELNREKLLSADTLSQMQLSIKEMFSSHPENKFMSQMYKMTVESFLTRKSIAVESSQRLKLMVDEFSSLRSEIKQMGEESELFINILYYQDSPSEFTSLTERLMGMVDVLLEGEDARRLKYIYEFFFDKMRPEQKNVTEIKKEAENISAKLTEERMLKKVISLIPKLNPEEAEDVGYILSVVQKKSLPLVIRAFTGVKEDAERKNFLHILRKLRNIDAEEIIRGIESSPAPQALELFDILEEIAPERAKEEAVRLLSHGSSRVRNRALGKLELKEESEIKSVFTILKNETDRKTQGAAISRLLEVGEKGVVERLFRMAGGRIFSKDMLLLVIEESGKLKSVPAVEQMGNILKKRSFFGGKKAEDIKAAAVSSLNRVHSDEAMKLIEEASSSGTKRIRDMCEAILKLDKR